MTGLSAIAGAAGEADARTLTEEVRKAREDRAAAQAADPTQEDLRTTESAVQETKFERQDDPREQTEEQARTPDRQAQMADQSSADGTGSLLNILA